MGMRVDHDEHEIRRQHAVNEALSAFTFREIIALEVVGVRPGVPLGFDEVYAALPQNGASMYVCLRLQKIYQSTDPSDDLLLRKVAHWQLCCTQGHHRDDRKGLAYIATEDDGHRFFGWQEKLRRVTFTQGGPGTPTGPAPQPRTAPPRTGRIAVRCGAGADAAPAALADMRPVAPIPGGDDNCGASRRPAVQRGEVSVVCPPDREGTADVTDHARGGATRSWPAAPVVIDLGEVREQPAAAAVDTARAGLAAGRRGADGARPGWPGGRRPAQQRCDHRVPTRDRSQQQLTVGTVGNGHPTTIRTRRQSHI
jgi:hypothetical protein